MTKLANYVYEFLTRFQKQIKYIYPASAMSWHTEKIELLLHGPWCSHLKDNWQDADSCIRIMNFAFTVSIFFLARHWGVKGSCVGNLTREHSKNGSKGVELEAVDDVSEMANFYGHEDAPGGQQEDVQALRHDAQPQHSCGEKPRL